MKLSKREKTLLILMSLMLVIGGYYKFVFSPQRQKLNSLTQQKEEYDKKLQDINMQIALKSKTEINIKDMNSKILNMTKVLFPSINQENFIVDIDKLLKDANLRGMSMTFSDIKAIPVEEKKNDTKDDKTSSLKGVIGEYNGQPSKSSDDKKSDNKNNSNTKDKPSVESISMVINFSGSYKTLIEFIKALEGYSKKIVISNLQITQSKTDEVTGSMQLEFYAIPKILDEDKEFFKWNYSNKYGKDNPFDGKISEIQANGTIEDLGKAKDENYDFVMSLRPVNSDLPTMMLGKSKDYSKQSYITADNPGITNVEVYLTQKDGKLTFPPDSSGDGEQFSIKDGNISFMIYSNKRIDKTDLSGVNLKIYNKTDKTVNVKIEGDDNSKPRVSISGEGGSVDIKRN